MDSNQCRDCGGRGSITRKEFVIKQWWIIEGVGWPWSPKFFEIV